MLRFLILCLVLSTAVTSEEFEDGSSGDDGDDEDGMIEEEEVVMLENAPVVNAGRGMIEGAEKAQGSEEKASRVFVDTDGLNTTIIIAVVCVVALAAVAIAAAVLVRRHMLNRQQGVYSVPVDQSEKPAI